MGFMVNGLFLLLPFCLANTESNSGHGLADFILQGLGSSAASTSASPTGDHTLRSSAMHYLNSSTSSPLITALVTTYLTGTASISAMERNATTTKPDKSAQACQTSQVGWTEKNLEIIYWNSTSVSTRTTTWVAYAPNATAYATIDGIPRAYGMPQALSNSTSPYPSTITIVTSNVSTIGSQPSPTCSIPTSQCSQLWQTYLASLNLPTTISDYCKTPGFDGHSFGFPTISSSCLWYPEATPMPTNLPQCSVGDASTVCASAIVGGACTIVGDSVQMFYWPERAGSNLSTSAIEGIVTTTIGKHTFTSPSVYLSFNQLTAVAPIFADDDCVAYLPLGATSQTMDEVGGEFPSPIGTATHNVLVAVDPGDLTSLVRDLGPGVNTADVVSQLAHGGPDYARWAYSIATPVTGCLNGGCDYSLIPHAVAYSDLPNPSPDTYYLVPQGAPGCNWLGPHPACSTIFDGAYRPQLAVPDVVRKLQPAWASCGMVLSGVYDPPKPLQPVQTIAAASTPNTNSATLTSTYLESSAAPVRATTVPTIAPESPSSTSTYSAPQLSTVVHASLLPSGSLPSAATADAASVQPSTDTPTSEPQTIVVVSVSVGSEGGPTISLPKTIPSPDSQTTSHSTEPQGSQNPDLPTLQTNKPSANGGPASENALSILESALSTALIPDPVTASGVTSSQNAGSAKSTAAKTNLPNGGDTSQAGPSLGIEVSSAFATPIFSYSPPEPIGPSVQFGAAVTVAGSTMTFSAGSQSGIAVGDGTTLQVGGAAMTFSSQIISLGSGGIVTGSSTVAYSALTEIVGPAGISTYDVGTGAVVSVGGGFFTVSADGHSEDAVVAGTTVHAGQVFTIGSQTISAMAGGIVLGTSTLEYSALMTTLTMPGSPTQSSEVGAVVTALGSTFTVAPSGYDGSVAMGGSTLYAGGPALTIGHQTFSVASSGIVVDGTTIDYSTIDPGVTASPEPPISGVSLQLGEQATTAIEIQPGEFAIGSQTISVGGPAITLSSEVISVVSDGLMVMNVTSSQSSPPSDPTSPTPTLVQTGGFGTTAGVGPPTSSTRSSDASRSAVIMNLVFGFAICLVTSVMCT